MTSAKLNPTPTPRLRRASKPQAPSPPPSLKLRRTSKSLSSMMFSAAECPGRINSLANRRMRIEQEPDECRWVFLGKILLRQPLHGGDKRVNVPCRRQRIVV